MAAPRGAARSHSLLPAVGRLVRVPRASRPNHERSLGSSLAALPIPSSRRPLPPSYPYKLSVFNQGVRRDGDHYWPA